MLLFKIAFQANFSLLKRLRIFTNFYHFLVAPVLQHSQIVHIMDICTSQTDKAGV